MSVDSSDRPPTPPRSAYEYDKQDTEGYCGAATLSAFAQTTGLRASKEYVPHMFDLVTPSRESASLPKKYIPPVFLNAESVDSSILLGRGASFSASLQKIPKGPEKITLTTQAPGWTMTRSVPAPSRPGYVVYKVARVAFQANGEPVPQHRDALQSVLTEYHALIYPPLFHHANIIDFLGFAWGSNPFSPAHKLPAIVVEYAQHGTLADLINKQKNLDLRTKHALCLDVARGLAAVHDAGLVHGDVKAQNVLICSGQDRNYVAKIADFGYSIVEATESFDVWIGGTNPWKAPEARRPIALKDLKKTDAYSLGLLIWLVCIDGKSPFDLIIANNVQGTARNAAIEDLKQGSMLLEVATARLWRMSWWLGKCVAPHLPIFSRIDVFQLYSRQETVLEELFRASEEFYNAFCQKKLVKGLNDIFNHTLQVDPSLRSLDVVIAILESDDSNDSSLSEQAKDRRTSLPSSEHSQPSEAARSDDLDMDSRSAAQTATPAMSTSVTDSATESKILSTSQATPSRRDALAKEEKVSDLPSWTRRGYKHRWISWQEMRHLEPSVQNFVFETFPGADGPQLLVLCAFYLNGYGCEVNVAEALAKLKAAVDDGHHISRAYMYRIISACRIDYDAGVPDSKYLYDYALVGSRPAFEDLRLHALEKAKTAFRFLTDACAGVGAPWFHKSEMLHGFTHSQWMNDEWLLEQAEKADPISHLILNKRGDSVLHFVAACGRHKPFKTLIMHYNMDINLQNKQGETPLLCACRSGQGGVAIICLQTFKADASVAATNGETPLHWLIMFEDINIEPLTNDLIANGADIKASTTERVAHSEFPGTIDVDFQLPGTPLSWAVHHNRPHIVRTLLKNGADPNLVVKGSLSSPLMTAAYYHHDECLRIMIEHLEEGGTVKTTEGNNDPRFVVTYGPLVREAVNAADRFSMMLRNGSKYLDRLHSTLGLLQEKTQYVNFQSSFEGNMLYFAVAQAHDLIVEYMFRNNWCVETLNDPCGDAQRTALIEAVRWNRRPLFRMLLEHGADIHAMAVNPFQPDLRTWSVLHVFAHEGHNKDLSLVETLVELGVPVEGLWKTTQEEDTEAPLCSKITGLSIHGQRNHVFPCETPLAVAIRHNAFHLASVLVSTGASPNSLSLSAGLFQSTHPLTILGHIIISNARYSSARLKYLLHLNPSETDFIVEPSRQLSALHRAAMAYEDVSRVDGEEVKKEEFDMETNRDIMYELLLRWPRSQDLNAQCGIRGNTAMHLAVVAENIGAVESLANAGADRVITNEDGETALMLAEKLAGQSKQYECIFHFLRDCPKE